MDTEASGGKSEEIWKKDIRSRRQKNKIFLNGLCGSSLAE